MATALLLSTIPACGEYNPALEGPASSELTLELVAPERALMIVDTGVVNDSTRTSDPCKNPASRKWGFGYLMTQMANQSSTGVSGQDFAMAWLDEWEKTQVINGHFLTPLGINESNPPVVSKIREQWRRHSGGGKLDLNKAPFRLLAIVNRFDLRTKPAAFKVGNAGELRFVFGVLNLDARESTGHCASMHQTGDNTAGSFASRSTVILEYAVDRPNGNEVMTYAKSWVALNKISNPADYRLALERITEGVVRAGVGRLKNRANGSALNALRLNESNDGGLWDFREFAINASTKKLRARTIAQTPIPFLNESEDLGMWAEYWGNEVSQGNHFVPSTFQQDPSALSTSYSNTKFAAAHVLSSDPGWTFNSDIDNQFNFSMNTCNGCHKAEGLQGEEVFHVHGRPFTQPAQLSPFLRGINPEDGTSPHKVIDFRDPTRNTKRSFSELERRRQHLGLFVAGASASSAAFQSALSAH